MVEVGFAHFGYYQIFEEGAPQGMHMQMLAISEKQQITS